MNFSFFCNIAVHEYDVYENVICPVCGQKCGALDVMVESEYFGSHVERFHVIKLEGSDKPLCTWCALHNWAECTICGDIFKQFEPKKWWARAGRTLYERIKNNSERNYINTMFCRKKICSEVYAMYTGKNTRPKYRAITWPLRYGLILNSEDPALAGAIVLRRLIFEEAKDARRKVA
jgi:rubredoxin